MNLTLHQLRLEFTRSKIALMIYFVILLCNYAVAAGWIGMPAISNDRGWVMEGLLPQLFILGYWIAFAMIVATCVLADSPARQDRFLHTRPLPGRSLGAAKALYILLAAVLPAALIEAASTATAGGSVGVVIYAAFERTLLCGTLALAVAAFAAHWKNTQGMVLAGVVAFVSFMILGQVVVSFVRSLGFPRILLGGEPTYLTLVQGFLILAGGLGLTAWVCSRRGRKFRYLIPAFVPVLVAAVYVFTSSPWRTAPYRPSDQGRIDGLLASESTSATVISRGYQISQNQGERELRATFAFAPIATGFPEDLELRWSTVNHRWLVDGKVRRRDNIDANLLGEHYVSSDGVSISWSLAHAIQNHLDSAVRFKLDQGLSHHSSSLMAQSLKYGPEGQDTGKEAGIETGVIGDAFSWKIAADLPLSKDESSAEEDPRSTWQIAAVAPSGHDFRILLTETAVSLHTSGNINHRSGGRRNWQKRHQFVLYLPGEAQAVFGSPGYERPVVSVSSAKRYYGEVEFEQDTSNPLSPERLKGARLLILQNEYIGRIETEFASPKFTLLDHGTHRGGIRSPYEDHEQWSPAQFALWFHRWEKLSPDQPADQVRAHLAQLLDQTARLESSIYNSREPSIIYAAAFVPRHLDFMLEKLPELPSRSVQFLVAAIAQGAEERQRQKIVEASVANDSLTAVVSQRGWYKDSRETLISLARDYMNSGSRFTRELLALDDPALDAVVLDIYRADPQPYIYELLRSIPRLAPETERITDELWRPGRLVVARGRPQGQIHFALLQGKQEALDELFAALRLSGESDGASRYDLANIIVGSIQIPKDVRGRHNNDEKIIKWILRHKSSDFEFNPVFRRFALKASPTSL